MPSAAAPPCSAKQGRRFTRVLLTACGKGLTTKGHVFGAI